MARRLATLALSLLLLPTLTGCLGGQEPEPVHQETTVTLELGPRESLEYKLFAAAGAQLTFGWEAIGPVVFDMHGEPEGVDGDVFESYRIGQSAHDAGDVTTSFQGQHGWFFDNRGRDPVTIELTVTGPHAVLGVL